MVTSALEGARYRRERLEVMQSKRLSSASTTPATPATPDAGTVRSGTKRNLKEGNPTSASATASSAVKGDEKVTPDPKHVRVECGPTPKELFASPREAESAEGSGLPKEFFKITSHDQRNNFAQPNVLYLDLTMVV